MKETLARLFSLRTKLIFGLSLIQLLLSMVLIFWWGHLLIEQAANLALLNQNSIESMMQFERTRRMVVWEGVWFLVALMILTFFFLGLYYRDLKRSRSIQGFFASMTHELKTPLTSVRLQAETMAESQMSETYLKALSHRLIQDTARLETQVERALELARIEGGGALFPRVVDMHIFLEKQIEALNLAESSRIKVEFQGERCRVSADPSALKSIVKNLFENSIRHGETSPIHVLFRLQTIANGMVRIDYEDNGVGCEIPKKDLGVLFNKGQRSHGAGVGLFLIRNLVEKMGGTVKFQDGPGFRMSLFLKSGEMLT